MNDFVISLMYVFCGIAAYPVGYQIIQYQQVTLVLQKLRIEIEPQPTPNPTIEIVGRMQGLIGFLLTLLGLSPITRFLIYGSELRFQSSSFWGQRIQFIPLRSVTKMTAGISKPSALIISAFTILMIGFFISRELRNWLPITFALIISMILNFVYVFSRRFFIEVYSQGGPPILLLYKPNVIEGVTIDSEKGLQVVGIIRDMILRNAATPNPGATSPPSSPPINTPSNDFGARTVAETLSWIPQPVKFEEVEEHVDAENVEHPDVGEDQEELAMSMYEQAKRYAQAGDHRTAIWTLREILGRYPQSEAAVKALRSLRKSGIAH